MPIIAFAIGASFGSFANVIMTRLNALSLLTRSKCLSCGTQIKAYDNIPILSFIFLRGKCRSCGSKFSSTYMWVELFMGMVGLLVWGRVSAMGLSMSLSLMHFALDIALFTILMSISLYDIKHKIVPSQLSTALLFTGLLSVILRLYDHQDHYGLMVGHSLMYNAGMELLAGVITALPYALLFFLSRGRWVGFGDVLVFLGVGWALGTVNGVYVFLYSVWVAGLFTIVWYMMEKKSGMMKIEIPFAPFIAIGTLIAYAYTSDMLSIHNMMLFGI